MGADAFLCQLVAAVSASIAHCAERTVEAVQKHKDEGCQENVAYPDAGCQDEEEVTADATGGYPQQVVNGGDGREPAEQHIDGGDEDDDEQPKAGQEQA